MKLYDILLWLLFILTLIVVFWYLFGDSPTLEQGLLILILTLLFAQQTTLYKIKTKLALQERKFADFEESFFRLASDFKTHLLHHKRKI